jgi:hypothetical protein
MLVLFKENYECVIKDTATIKVGDMLCDLLNLDLTRLMKSGKELLSLLRSIDIVSADNEELFNSTVSSYLELLKAKLKLIEPYKTEIKKLPFYMYTKDVDNAFDLLDDFAGGLCSQLMHRPPQSFILDAAISYDMNVYKKAVQEILLPIQTSLKCNQFYRSMMDACLLYDPSNADDKPILRLKEYGLEKFNEQAGKAVKPALAPSPALSVTYEIVEDNGSLSLLQSFDFATLPQFIYQEFMKMVSLNLYVRHCKNCGKYFVIYGERMLEYCGNIPEGETKSCSIIGPARLYGQRVKNDPILEIYTRAYKKYVARRRSGTISPDEFKAWTVKARKLRDKAHKENTPLKEFMVWMQ